MLADNGRDCREFAELIKECRNFVNDMCNRFGQSIGDFISVSDNKFYCYRDDYKEIT